MTAAEIDRRLDLRARLQAILSEASRGDPDDVVAVIAEGALEALDELLTVEADRPA